jgi:uncharacterized protein YdeI (YjbR/CyaY-like superfamily)
MDKMLLKPKFFTSPEAFRQWLEKNHSKYVELWVGFHKKGTGKKTISYAEALDEALCFGWIDGVRKSFNNSSYIIRFTPRKAKSIWSLVNTGRAQELTRLGRMAAPGIAAFSARDPRRTGVYSFESSAKTFSASFEKKFRANGKAWEFFSRQPLGYRNKAIFWIMSAKQEETRLRRLDQIISDSEQNRRQGMITGAKKT